VSKISRHVGAGLTWTGPIPDRDEEVLGIGATWVRLSEHPDFSHDYELALELFYKIGVASWFTRKPDLQYIIKPSGGGSRDDALVAIMRVELTF
jgi:porin